MRYLVVPLTVILAIFLVLASFILLMLLRGDVSIIFEAFPFLAQ